MDLTIQTLNQKTEREIESEEIRNEIMEIEKLNYLFLDEAKEKFINNKLELFTNLNLFNNFNFDNIENKKYLTFEFLIIYISTDENNEEEIKLKFQKISEKLRNLGNEYKLYIKYVINNNQIIDDLTNFPEILNPLNIYTLINFIQSYKWEWKYNYLFILGNNDIYKEYLLHSQMKNKNICDIINENNEEKLKDIFNKEINFKEKIELINKKNLNQIKTKYFSEEENLELYSEILEKINNTGIKLNEKEIEIMDFIKKTIDIDKEHEIIKKKKEEKEKLKEQNKILFNSDISKNTIIDNNMNNEENNKDDNIIIEEENKNIIEKEINNDENKIIEKEENKDINKIIEEENNNIIKKEINKDESKIIEKEEKNNKKEENNNIENEETKNDKKNINEKNSNKEINNNNIKKKENNDSQLKQEIKKVKKINLTFSLNFHNRNVIENIPKNAKLCFNTFFSSSFHGKCHSLEIKEKKENNKLKIPNFLSPSITHNQFKTNLKISNNVYLIDKEIYNIPMYDYYIEKSLIGNFKNEIPLKEYNLNYLLNNILIKNAICEYCLRHFNLLMYKKNINIKLNSNDLYEITFYNSKYLFGQELIKVYQNKYDKKIIETFSHFSYCLTYGNILIDNIIEYDGKIYLFDLFKIDSPNFIYFLKFFKEHHCNEFCEELSLKNENFFNIISQENINLMTCELCKNIFQKEKNDNDNEIQLKNLCNECKEKTIKSKNKLICISCSNLFEYYHYYYIHKKIDLPSLCNKCSQQIPNNN